MGKTRRGCACRGSRMFIAYPCVCAFVRVGEDWIAHAHNDVLFLGAGLHV